MGVSSADNARMRRTIEIKIIQMFYVQQETDYNAICDELKSELKSRLTNYVCFKLYSF